MLHRAGITYVDAYFDVPAGGKGGKTPSEQAWSRTRERRASLLDDADAPQSVPRSLAAPAAVTEAEVLEKKVSPKCI